MCLCYSIRATRVVNLRRMCRLNTSQRSSYIYTNCFLTVERALLQEEGSVAPRPSLSVSFFARCVRFNTRRGAICRLDRLHYEAQNAEQSPTPPHFGSNRDPTPLATQTHTHTCSCSPQTNRKIKRTRNEREVV